MNSERHNGIILKTIPYSDQAQIAMLFTEERGMMSVFVTHASVKAGGGSALITPMNEVEMVMMKGSGELWRCRECYLKEGFVKLRTNIDSLQGGIELLRAILQSQPEGKPAPLLYALLKNYLNQLKQGESSYKIIASFYVKILRHEGLWSDEIPEELSLTAEEWNNCRQLAYCRSAKELAACNIAQPASFIGKVRTLFEERLQ